MTSLHFPHNHFQVITKLIYDFDLLHLCGFDLCLGGEWFICAELIACSHLIMRGRSELALTIMNLGFFSVNVSGC